jgi:hypothetical protein
VRALLPGLCRAPPPSRCGFDAQRCYSLPLFPALLAWPRSRHCHVIAAVPACFRGVIAPSALSFYVHGMFRVQK